MTEKHAFSMRTFAANVRRCIDRQKLTITLAKIAEGLGVPLWVLMRPDPQSGCEKLKGKSSSIATAFEWIGPALAKPFAACTARR